MGFSGYLVKPIRAASLAAMLAPSADLQAIAYPADDRAVLEIAEPRHPRGLAVLVAEDNEINALLARSLLAKLGHRVTVAENGAQAYACWQAASAAAAAFDLILMDVHMPEVDGIEATQRIRAAEAEAGAARTRIVALSANAFAEDREACLAAGMDGFLIKPLDRDQLAAVLAGSRERGALAA
jgi:CheY-like chemotaxis protein